MRAPRLYSAWAKAAAAIAWAAQGTLLRSRCWHSLARSSTRPGGGEGCEGGGGTEPRVSGLVGSGEESGAGPTRGEGLSVGASKEAKVGEGDQGLGGKEACVCVWGGCNVCYDAQDSLFVLFLVRFGLFSFWRM